MEGFFYGVWSVVGCLASFLLGYLIAYIFQKGLWW